VSEVGPVDALLAQLSSVASPGNSLVLVGSLHELYKYGTTYHD
jgi:hypothetical protein